ncbi:MAG: SURF1 family protein [Methylococcales bacterium]
MNKRWLYYLFSLLLCLAFFSLGRWQLSRAEWKQQRLDKVALILKEKKPEPLSQLSKENKTDLAWSAGRGHFLTTPALFHDNQRLGDKVGVNVYRIFQPDGGKALLVNLGWLPVPGNRRMPELEKISGSYQLSGLLAAPPSPGIALGPAYQKTSGHYWLLTRMPLDELATDLKTPLATRVLRLNPDLPMGYARDLDVLPNTLPPEKHKGYAVQWFGLCLATIVITFVLGFRRKNTLTQKMTQENKND